MKQKRMTVCGLLSLIGLLSAGCSTVAETKTRELNRMADNTLAKMVLEQPGLQAELGAAAAAIVFEWSASGVPMVGTRGVGMLIETSSNERTPIRITKLEIKGARGIGGYFGLLVIHDDESAELAKTVALSLENRGTLYIYVKGEPSAAYPLKNITIKP